MRQEVARRSKGFPTMEHRCRNSHKMDPLNQGHQMRTILHHQDHQIHILPHHQPQQHHPNHHHQCQHHHEFQQARHILNTAADYHSPGALDPPWNTDKFACGTQRIENVRLAGNPTLRRFAHSLHVTQGSVIDIRIAFGTELIASVKKR